MKVDLYDIIFKRNIYRKMKEITSQKKTIQSQKNKSDSEGQETFALIC